MKKIIFVLSLFTGIAVNAQDCTEIFISEYLEGHENNKALEIYNPTDSWVNLGNYFVVRYDNGNSAPTLLNAIQLRGSLAPKSVHVGVIDKRDTLGQGQEAAVWDDLAAKADEWYCPDYNVSKAFYWNGNDAVVLFKGKLPTDVPLAFRIDSIPNIQPIDVFGKIGENPGEASQGGGWTYDGTPVAQGGAVVSADHFLVRKPNVKRGNPLNPTVFIPANEWDTLSFLVYAFDENGDTLFNSSGNPKRRMNVDDLGRHTCDCGDATSIEEEFMPTFGFEIYPNPSTNGQLTLLSTDKVAEVVVVNAMGQVVEHIRDAKSYMVLQLNVPSGVYFITAKGENGLTQTKKFIIQ